MIDKEFDKNINNGEILFMVFYPILVPCFGIFAPAGNLLRLLAFLPYIAWIIVWIRDIKRIKRAGIYVDVWQYTGIIGLFISPIYFWVRKIKTNTGATLPTLNTVLWSIVFLYHFFNR